MSVHTREPSQTPLGSDELPVSSLVHRSLLHKRASAEVLIWAPRRTCDGTTFTVELPPTHRTVRLGSTKIPLVLLLEAVRQLGIAVAHYELSAPLGSAFIANSMSLHWMGDPVSFPAYGPVEFEAQVRAVDIKTRNGAVSGLTAEARLDHDGRPVACAAGGLSFVPQATYRAIRRHAHVSTSRDMRTDAEPLMNVQRHPGWRSAQVGWDWRDRFYFDHDADHLPGIVLVAAACEAQRLLSGEREPAAVTADFSRYAELDVPIDIAARPDDHAAGSIRVTFTQDTELIANAIFEY